MSVQLKIFGFANSSKISGKSRHVWSKAGDEPSIDELLADPIVDLVMARDRLTRSDLDAVVANGRRIVRSRLCPACCAA